MTAGPHATPAAPPPPGRTRWRFGFTSAVLVIAATVSMVVLNLLAERYPLRADVTATREQRLSPRTEKLLDSLTSPYEIVIAADWRSLDPRAGRRVKDVLDLFRRATPRVTTTTIDVTTAAGLASYESLLQRLGEREAPKVKEQTGVIAAAADAAGSLADSLEALGPRVRAVRDAIAPDALGAESNKRFFDEQGARCAAVAEQLRATAAKTRATLAAPAGPLGVPDLEAAADPLRRDLVSLETGLRSVTQSVREFVDAETQPAAARNAARPLTADLQRCRDTAAVNAETLTRLPRLDAVRVARTLQTTEAALVIGPPDAGLTAIPFAWLFPPGDAIDAAAESRADMRRRNEELFAAGIDVLARPVNPIVVLVHGFPHRLLDRTRAFTGLVERLGHRGISVAEWPAALSPEPPNLIGLNPKGDRPVVYVSFSDDAAKGASGGAGSGGSTGPQRADALGDALARLTEEGRPLLVSIIPSPLPTAGAPDKTVAMLPLFGLRADSARPLLRDALTTGGRIVIPNHVLLADSADHPDHPITGAVRGLRTLFEWPVPLKTLAEGDAARARTWPLFTLNESDAWAEAEWLALWTVAAPGTRGSMPPNPPAKDSTRDDAQGPWVVAAAAERDLPQGRGTQRLVAVGSNTWFTDRVASQQASMVDGRVSATNPGNIELFEAAVYWLAGQDDRIGASATARAVPIIRALEPGTLAALRWTVIAGLPALTLLAGVLWRVWRG
ncbi:MAG: hypothetical protein ACKVU4_11005 [Phycisphaerales bacterium]